MPLLKHPTAGTIIDVTGARAKTLSERGYTEVDVDGADLARAAAAPGGAAQRAVQPQPPIDARDDPPEPPVETRPDDAITDPPIDTRPPNPLGSGEGGQPAKSATKADWVAYAETHGVEDPDAMTKDELIERLGR